MKLSRVAQVDIARPPTEVFALATDVGRFAHLLKAYGPVPGVKSVEPLDEKRRRVRLSDGTHLDEEVFEVDPPRLNRYRWVSRPKPPFSWLIKDAVATWTFDPAGGGTHVVWRYDFELTTPLVVGFAAILLAVFGRWMQRGLDAVRDTAQA